MSSSPHVSYVRIAVALALLLCVSTANSVVVFNDDFENGLGNWSISSGSGSAVINTQTANSPSSSLRLGEEAVELDSVTIDTSGSVGVEVSAWIRRGSDSFSENPDSGEDLSVQYLNVSNNWITLETFSGSGTQGEIYDRQYTLGSDAVHAGFRLRFRLADGSGSPFDYWHVDDVVVDTISNATLPLSAHAEWRFDEDVLSGAVDEVRDSSGNNYHGFSSNVTPAAGLLCNAADMSATGVSDFISVNGNALDGLSDFTIVAWVQTTQSSTFAMLSAANGNSDLEANEAVFLFDNGNEFWPAITSSSFNSNTKLPATSTLNNGSWHQVAWTRNASTAQSCLFFDGVLEGCVTHTDGNDNSPLNVAVNGLILGQEQDDLAGDYDATQALEGLLDEMIVFDSRLNGAQLSTIKNNIESGSNWDGSARSCSLAGASDLEFRMDEASWSGVADEVVDSSGNSNNATARGGLTTIDPGHLCRGGDFDGVDDYIESNEVYDLLKGTASMSFWIKTTQTGDNTGWRAPGIAGVEQAGGSDDIFWGWLDASGRIGVSVANDFTSKSTFAINDDVYHHIVLTRDASSGAYKIYIDGNLNKSGTLATGIIGNSFSSIGQIEDTGGTPEFFRGQLDEVKIFGRVLSGSDVTTLFNETRVCTLPTGCAASFPDALSSYNSGTLSLASGISIASLDNALPFGAITPVSNNACGGSNCSADTSTTAPTINPGAFPDTSAYTNDLTIPNNGTGTIGGSGTTQYDRVSVGKGGTLNVSASFGEYFIDELAVGNNVVVNLQPGTYWINTYSAGNNTNFKVSGSGTARILFNNSVSFNKDMWVNNGDVSGTWGDPSKLLMYGYGGISFNNNSRFWGAIYAQQMIQIGKGSLFEGAFTADDISIGKNTSITYDAAAISSIDFGSVCGGSCALGRFEITQPTYGLACPSDRAEINIKAMCADGVTAKTDYNGTVDLSTNENSQSEFFLLQTGGTEVTSAMLTAGEVNVYLFHKNENHDVKVTASDSASSISSEAANGTDFRTSGFRVTKPNDFVCGSNESFTVTAIGQDVSSGGACTTLTGFTGNKALKAWADIGIDPATPATKVTGLPERILLNDSPVAVTRPASSNVNASFSSGVANVTVKYLDVGNVIDVSFVHDDLPYDGSVPEVSDPSDPGLKGSTGSFVVYPKEVQVNANGTGADCLSGDATCDKFVAANAEFSVTTKAVCDNGTDVAQSYIGEVKLTHSLVAPTGGELGNLALKTTNIASGLGGQITFNQKISEVGVFKLIAAPDNYFSKILPLFTSPNVGRFYPDHFKVSISGGEFGQACAAAFTYMDQPFSFAASAAPSITITAENKDNDTTKNYEGDFWKLGSDLQQTSTCGSGTGTVKGFCYEDVALSGAPFQRVTADAPYPAITDTDGVVTFDLHPTAEFVYSRPITVGTLVAPFDADVKLSIELKDSDGVEGGTVKEHIGFMGDTINVGAGENDFNDSNSSYLRYGRWVLENAFGPETNSLKIPMSAQYYDGTNFVTNTLDSCSTFNDLNMVVAPDLKSGGTTSASGNGTAAGGRVLLADQVELSAPGEGHDGTAALCLNVENWLKFDWDGNGLDLNDACDTNVPMTKGDNPMSTATFGRYRGHDRIIYWREVNN